MKKADYELALLSIALCIARLTDGGMQYCGAMQLWMSLSA